MFGKQKTILQLSNQLFVLLPLNFFLLGWWLVQPIKRLFYIQKDAYKLEDRNK